MSKTIKTIDMKEPEIFLCNYCKGVMTVRPDATGVTVICLNPCLETCHENVFGHGKNAREAWEISNEKFRKPS